MTKKQADKLNEICEAAGTKISGFAHNSTQLCIRQTVAQAIVDSLKEFGIKIERVG